MAMTDETRVARRVQACAGGRKGGGETGQGRRVAGRTFRLVAVRDGGGAGGPIRSGPCRRARGGTHVSLQPLQLPPPAAGWFTTCAGPRDLPLGIGRIPVGAFECTMHRPDPDAWRPDVWPPHLTRVGQPACERGLGARQRAGLPECHSENTPAPASRSMSRSRSHARTSATSSSERLSMASVTITGYPGAAAARETHGRCVPVSVTTVAPSYRARNAASTSREVTIVSLARIPTAAPRTPAWRRGTPRSNPTVSFSPAGVSALVRREIAPCLLIPAGQLDFSSDGARDFKILLARNSFTSRWRGTGSDFPAFG